MMLHKPAATGLLTAIHCTTSHGALGAHFRLSLARRYFCTASDVLCALKRLLPSSFS